LHSLVRSLQLGSATTVSPTWTTSHSQSLLKVQRDTKGANPKVFTDHKQKNLIWDVLGITAYWMYQLRLQLKKYLAQDNLHQRHIHKTDADAIAWLEYDPIVNQTAESYLMTKVNKNSKCSQRQAGNSIKTMVQTMSKHQQAWRFKAHVCKTWKQG
jgi:hypothetical protein